MVLCALPSGKIHTVTTYWRNPATGLIEGVTENGQVVSVQKSLDEPFDSTTKAGFTEKVRPDGSIYWVQDGVATGESRSWAYSPMLGGVIAGEISAGGAISTLCKKFTWCPPYAILARWMQRIPEFKEMVDEAIKHRAVVHFEEIIQTADEVYATMKDDPDNAVQAAKMKIDARKFTVEKGDADKFGSKGKVTGDVNVQIVIDTGIRREPIDVTPKPQEIKDA